MQQDFKLLKSRYVKKYILLFKVFILPPIYLQIRKIFIRKNRCHFTKFILKLFFSF